MMKNIINKILLGLGLLASVACSKIDNYDGPDASLEGNLIDTETGENFLTAPGNIQVRIYQISWSATPSPQDIPSKIDGTFKDTKLFSGRYKAIPVGGAFWPVLDTLEFDIKGGSKQNFELTPYIVIRNLTHELNGQELTLRFDIDVPMAGIPMIIDAQPYINTTKIVGPGASIYDYSDAKKKSINKEWSALSEAEKSIELKVPDLVSGRTFYVRVGVKVNDSYKSSNLSQIIEVKVP